MKCKPRKIILTQQSREEIALMNFSQSPALRRDNQLLSKWAAGAELRQKGRLWEVIILMVI